ncbi:ATP-binding protein [Lyngbya confervoides]|uniref:ATP-binding protein n=1 Tax=Lyngbya confervoides BDU141951 TaxID=1574623 RepID=A0ABD4T7X1_9CYAN|nr:ATP-binding protein [Lyngbya confervoides]MCM1984387.1 ATP-binding protein [Lyngbya confervoides BDU141951]
MDLFQLRQALAALIIFPTVFDDEVGQAFQRAVTAGCQALSPTSDAHQIAQALDSCSRWCLLLLRTAQSWPHHLENRLRYADNPLAQQCFNQTLSPQALAGLQQAAEQDLQQLQHIAQHGPKLLWQQLARVRGDQIPWMPIGSQVAPLLGEEHWPAALPALMAGFERHGTGLLAQYKTLRWCQGQLVGIADPDPVRLDQLVGYEVQREKLCRNTEALLQGYPALNVLLYGARGTGKSALIKALIHDYGDRGLRLIEINKADLVDLPAVVQQLAEMPHKCVLFVDDLSFEADEDQYKGLKVALEGTLRARPANVVVYATSNRRHLLREFFGDRPRPQDADEIHSWDTVQEKLSLSDRFGLSLTFEPVNQAQYLRIVAHLAQRAGLHIDQADLDFRALQWASQQNGRSGRTAQQFIQALEAELNRVDPDSAGRFV